MNIHNFKLSNVFHDNAKEYSTRPVMAAKYQPGMENSWMVYYSNMGTKKKNSMMYEGIRFFLSEAEAQNFISRNEKQYAIEKGELVSIDVEYDLPKPVLCRKDGDAINKEGMHLCFVEQAFVSDESCDYEFYILESDCWIIQDMGNIRVWYPDSEETFFGKDKEIVYEKAIDQETYIPVVV